MDLELRSSIINASLHPHLINFDLCRSICIRFHYLHDQNMELGC